MGGAHRMMRATKNGAKAVQNSDFEFKSGFDTSLLESLFGFSTMPHPEEIPFKMKMLHQKGERVETYELMLSFGDLAAKKEQVTVKGSNAHEKQIKFGQIKVKGFLKASGELILDILTKDGQKVADLKAQFIETCKFVGDANSHISGLSKVELELNGLKEHVLTVEIEPNNSAKKTGVQKVRESLSLMMCSQKDNRRYFTMSKDSNNKLFIFAGKIIDDKKSTTTMCLYYLDGSGKIEFKGNYQGDYHDKLCRAQGSMKFKPSGKDKSREKFEGKFIYNQAPNVVYQEIPADYANGMPPELARQLRYSYQNPEYDLQNPESKEPANLAQNRVGFNMMMLRLDMMKMRGGM